MREEHKRWIEERGTREEQELSAGAEMRAEWQGWPRRGLKVSLGPEEIQWLAADAS